MTTPELQRRKQWPYLVNGWLTPEDGPAVMYEETHHAYDPVDAAERAEQYATNELGGTLKVGWVRPQVADAPDEPTMLCHGCGEPYKGATLCYACFEALSDAEVSLNGAAALLDRAADRLAEVSKAPDALTIARQVRRAAGEARARARRVAS